jgi:hypothetical protein
MLGSWSEHSTSKEQIKNIIDNNSHEAQMSEKATAPGAAKNCTQAAALIMTR